MAVTNDNIGYALDDFWQFATQRDNLALGDPENLSRGGLGKISLTGCAYIGGSDPDQYITTGMGYSGTCAGVQLLSGNLLRRRMPIIRIPQHALLFWVYF